MSRGRKGEKTYKGFNGARESKLHEARLLQKTPAGMANSVLPLSPERLREAIANQTCPWCGAGPYIVLSTHTGKTHGVSADELREMAGLTKGSPTCAQEYSRDRAEMRAGVPLPASAYEKARVSSRQYSKAGLETQRRKLDAARSPEQVRAASRASTASTRQKNATKYAEILELNRQDPTLTFKAIGEAVGMNPASVRRILVENGVDISGHRSQIGAGRSMGAATDAYRRAAERKRTDRLARFSKLGGDWAACERCASEWGVSAKTAREFLRTSGAIVPDGRLVSPKRLG